MSVKPSLRLSKGVLPESSSSTTRHDLESAKEFLSRSRVNQVKRLNVLLRPKDGGSWLLEVRFGMESLGIPRKGLTPHQQKRFAIRTQKVDIG